MDEQSMFLAALEKKTPVARAQWLAETCGTDGELKARIEALIERHHESSSFLEHAPAEFEATIIPDGSNQDRAESLKAGLAAAFSEGQSVVIGSAGHSVLKSLARSIHVPRVILRDVEKDGADPITRPKSPEMPDRISDSRYQLQGEIARGGMGAILKGRDTDLGRDLAIKVLLDQHRDKPEMIQRFVEEAQIGGQLQHPGIAPIYELGQFADRRPFFAMKLIKGETLAKLLADRKDAAAERAKFIGIFEQICQTMAYAHSRGVIHRDLKPANIMVGAFGEVQVMDWGLAKVLSNGGVADEKKAYNKQQGQSIIQTLRSQMGSDVPGTFGTYGSQTQMGSVMGTPAYMPPEQALGEIDSMDERADVFGLGAILCEILTGKPPYVADDATRVFRLASRGKLDDCFQRLKTCGADEDLVALTRHCLELEPANRPRVAGILAERVSEYLESAENKLRSTELAKVDAQARAEELVRRRRLLYAIATMLLIGLIGTAFMATHFRSLERAQRSLAVSNELLAREREAERISAVAAQQDSDRQRDAAQQARLNSLDQTYSAVLSEIRLKRLARQSGWRSAALQQLGELTLLGSRKLDRVELRSEALACLAEMDVRQVSVPEWSRKGDWRTQYSPDGQSIAFNDTATTTVVLHDVATGQQFTSIPLAVRLSPFAFHPDGTLLVASSEGHVTYHPVRSQQSSLPEITGDGYPLNLAFSKSGHRLAVAWGDVDPRNFGLATRYRQVTVHDTATGTTLWASDLPAGTPGGWKVPLALSPDGETLATTGPEVQARLYSVGTSEEPIVLGQLDTRICAIDFHPDGRSLVAAGRLTGLVWDLQTRLERFRLHAPEDGLWDIAYSPDGQLLAGALNGHTARLWDVSSGRELAVIPLDTDVCLSLGFAPQGDRFTVGGSSAVTFQIEGRLERRSDLNATNQLNGLAFHSQQRALLALANGTLLRWDLNRPNADVVGSIPRSECPSVLQLTPDGGHLAIGFDKWLGDHDFDDDYSLRIQRLGEPVTSRRLTGPLKGVHHVAFSESGLQIAAGSQDGRLYVWEFETGTLRNQIHVLASAVQFLDESQLVVASGNRLIVLGVDDGSIVREVTFNANICALVLTADRSQAIVATDDSSVHRLRIADLTIEATQPVVRRPSKTVSRLTSDDTFPRTTVAENIRPSNTLLALTSDDTLLAVATQSDSQCILLDARSLNTLARLPVNDVWARYVEFDPNSRYLALAGGQLTLWDLGMVRRELSSIGLGFDDLSTDEGR